MDALDGFDPTLGGMAIATTAFARVVAFPLATLRRREMTDHGEERTGRPFMGKAGKELNRGLELAGLALDERGVPLDARVLDQVSSELEALYDQLDSRDLAAGSLLARRLFS